MDVRRVDVAGTEVQDVSDRTRVDRARPIDAVAPCTEQRARVDVPRTNKEQRDSTDLVKTISGPTGI